MTIRRTEEWLANRLRRSADRAFAPLLKDAALVAPNAARSKHGAVKTQRGAMVFDSKREANAWDALALDQAAGAITHLQRQVRFPFTVDGVCVGSYRADFVFRRAGVFVVADAKSPHTRTLPGWARTKKLMLACYGVAIEEI